jgi:flagellar protein FliO/FliZ
VLKEPVQVPGTSEKATPEFAQHLLRILGKDQKDKK